MMPNYKMVFQMLARGGTSQRDVAAICGCSKRDVSRAAAYIKETGRSAESLATLADSEIRSTVFPRKERELDEDYLRPDVGALVARKLEHPKLTVKLFWYEHCAEAESRKLKAYSYQQFCDTFSAEAKRVRLADHLRHVPGAKLSVDYSGLVGWLTDKPAARRSKVWVMVFCLPASCRIFAEGFLDMTERSWLDGHADAFEFFGGVPRMLIPDNCSQATDRTSPYLTLVNRTYRDFASHYGCAVVPARVRAPRDKGLAEASVDLVEKWAIAPSSEMTFYTLAEFNEYLLSRVGWTDARPFSEREGSRDSDFEERERPALMPLPPTRFEVFEWRRAKVAPNYHVRVDYQYYSVPHGLVGRTVDVRLGDGGVTILLDGEVVAEHPRSVGRRGQYSTRVEHMPESHRALPDPWSADRFASWAERVGPTTGEAIRRVLASHPIVEQGFVPCRNILGLSKAYGPERLERTCERLVTTSEAVPTHTALKNMILAAGSEAGRRGTAAAGSWTGRRAPAA